MKYCFTISIVFFLILVVGIPVLVYAIDAGTLVNPLTDNTNPIDVNALFARIIKAFLGVAGALALAFTMYGGVEWMTSGGNAEKIQSGRDTLMWAVLGLAVVLLSYVILNFLLSSLQR